ncbi:MAG: hypothetical protein BWZ10_02140 [candidate division BRC1 bacterium ADurb.BinA364]|nr:MAG: hypothetical protein BWZ10_02140 [candidate division BRC1 bacterium ADurb.BinA364]
MDADGACLGQRQHRRDGVRGVPHWRQSGPIGRPAFHVLVMGAAQELNAAEFAAVAQGLGIEELPGENGRFHHHIVFSGLALGLDDRPKVGHADRHRHGAGAVLAGAQGGDGLRGVVRNAGYQMNGVDIVGLNRLLDRMELPGDAESSADATQPLRVEIANGDRLDIGMIQVNRHEFGAESHSSDRDANFPRGCWHSRTP